jgi:hypothetical protein
MNELRVRGKFLGQDFDVSNCLDICLETGEDILYSMPTSKREGVTDNFGLSVPILCSPIFILPNMLNYFKYSTKAKLVFPLSCVSEFCEIMENKVKLYKTNLTGEINPDLQAMQGAVLNVDNFGRFLM